MTHVIIVGATGLHVVMAPGIYQLEASLEITKSDTVLLGIGLATLMPTAGTPAVTVDSKATGVRVAGLLLQAGVKVSTTLLQWGDPSPDGKRTTTVGAKVDIDDSAYGFIHDVNARVGGPAMPNNAEVAANSMIQIDASHVIGDNMWLWRVRLHCLVIFSLYRSDCD